MSWLKHMANAGDDPFIVALMDEFGPTGYWVFFRTLELMRQNFKPETSGKLNESLSFFRQKLRIRSTSIKRIYTFIGEKNKFLVEFKGGMVFVYCPNFKRYMDRYARRLLQENVDTRISESTSLVHPCIRRDLYTEDVNSSGSQAIKRGPLSTLVYRSLKKLIRR